MTRRELPRGVFERHPGSGVYWIRYADAHGRERKEKVGPRLQLAVLLYQKRKVEVAEGRKFPENLRYRAATFSELAADFEEYARAHHGIRTRQVDGVRLETALAKFRNRIASSISSQEFARFLGNPKWKPATRNRYRALFSKCYSLAIRNGKATENPLKHVDRFKENNARVRFLDPMKEEPKLRAAIKRRFPSRLAEFDLALNTGMRRGEQYNLRWSDVDLRRKLLTIQNSKNGDRRHIPLNDQAQAALHKMRSTWKAGAAEFVVRATHSERLGNYPTWFDKCVGRAGVVDFHWHDLRHTFASRLVMAGADIRTVQDLMGHKMLTMTVRYAHLSAPHLHEAVALLENA